jgi:hypothetical protein
MWHADGHLALITRENVDGGGLAMRHPTPSNPFPWAWTAFELGDVRPCNTTYCEYPYKSLPPIPELDGTLSWLGKPGWPESPDESPEQRASHHRLTENARGEVRTLVVHAERLGLRLPPAFTRLMSAPDLQARIPEYAGCWFNLYEAQLVPCPDSDDGFVVRFLNDQQDCILWYLYVTRQGDEAVLAVGDPYPDAPSPFLERLVMPDEDDGPLTDKQRQAVLANIYACAPSFEAFVYRWWLEATIYMKLSGFDNEPLTDEERRYLAHYQHGRLAQ